LRAGCVAVPILTLASGGAAGPVLLIGDAADNHGPQDVYAGLVHQVITNVTNGQTGILALGVDVGSDAGHWLIGLSAQLPEPQIVAFVNDETISAIGFSGYGLIYVPSPATYTTGGITQAESDLLNARASDLATFLDNGGGLVALTQGNLENPYGFLGEFAPVDTIAVGPSGLCGKESLYDNIAPTRAGELFGITADNLDGCCWGNVYTPVPETMTALAVADAPTCSTLNNNAAILIGFVDIPDIGFGDPVVEPAAGVPTVESVGDLDGDGDVDVVAVIPNEDPRADGLIQVFRNQGVDSEGAWGGLAANDPIPVGANPGGGAIGLFNDDDTNDLAVINTNDNDVWIFVNTGKNDATFTLLDVVAAGNQPIAIVADDFTEDGIIDLAVASGLDASVLILVNNGNGNFSALELPQPTIIFQGFEMLGGDFDGNKCPDLTGGGQNSGGQLIDGGQVFVMLGQGGGAFDPPVFYDVGQNPTDLAVGDLDGDGFPDISTSDSSDNTISILINRQDGTFAPRITLNVGQNPTSVDVVDLNLDGRLELVVVADDPFLGPAIQVLENQTGAAVGESISFGNPVAFGVGADPNFVANADFNTDGLSDLVTINLDENAPDGGSVTVLLNDPPSPPCEGDFNGDGFVNIVDLLEMFMNWGPCPPGCPWDLNGDGEVGIMDVLQLFSIWGICPGNGCPWDLNGDGVVDGQDVAELLQNLGDCEDPDDCPADLDGDGTVGLLDLWALLLHLGDCE